MTDRISTDELRKLLAEATDGPWGFSLCTCGHPSCDQHVMNNQGSVGFSPEDARLIATAPDLAAEVIELREALERIEAEVTARMVRRRMNPASSPPSTTRRWNDE